MLPEFRRTTQLPLAACLCALLSSLVGPAADAAPPVRIRDITQVAGEHANVLVGQGLVTGLAGTGGKSPITKFNAINFMQRMGLRSDPLQRELYERSQEKTDNLSTVTVTAILPPHSKKNQRIDVIVTAFDEATSLQGGMLLPTELTGVDGVVYAIAAGPVSTNGGSFGGEAATVVKNHPTTGRIANGATVEEDVPVTVFEDGMFRLLLNSPQYETAVRITDAINGMVPGCALTFDPSTVLVRVPDMAGQDPYRFIARCQELTILPDVVAKVIINERTGTLVINENVRISSVALTHGNLIVRTVETPQVSQPAPFSEGETTVVPRTEVDVTEEQSVISVLEDTSSVADLAAALNALGATPRDLSVILQMMKESGALHAEVELK